jgi:hypothetical protein
MSWWQVVLISAAVTLVVDVALVLVVARAVKRQMAGMFTFPAATPVYGTSPSSTTVAADG